MAEYASSAVRNLTSELVTSLRTCCLFPSSTRLWTPCRARPIYRGMAHSNDASMLQPRSCVLAGLFAKCFGVFLSLKQKLNEMPLFKTFEFYSPDGSAIGNTSSSGVG
jgi:hypothetical protein